MAFGSVLNARITSRRPKGTRSTKILSRLVPPMVAAHSVEIILFRNEYSEHEGVQYTAVLRRLAYCLASSSQASCRQGRQARIEWFRDGLRMKSGWIGGWSIRSKEGNRRAFISEFLSTIDKKWAMIKILIWRPSLWRSWHYVADGSMKFSESSDYGYISKYIKLTLTV